MRIIYNYIFDITKIVKRNEIIQYVLEFMQRSSLHYEDVLFELSMYKDNAAKGKTYFEKLCEKDLFWGKYKTQYACDFAQNTSIVGISNLENGKWIKRKIEEEDKLNDIVDKLEEQLKVMPQYGYKIAFNNIKWFCVDEVKHPLMVSGTPELYPLSSNITILKHYPHKRHIVLSFEMCSEYKNHKIYVDDFSKWTGCTYIKEVQFVKDESEKAEYSRAYLQVNKLLKQIENTKISMEKNMLQETKKLHTKKILKDVFCEMDLKFEGEGIYEINKIDKYRNKLTIYFDYEREHRSLCATLTYRGIGYKYSVKYLETKPILCDEVIKQYAMKVRNEVDKFVNDYVPQIIEYYKPVPEWYEWE